MPRRRQVTLPSPLPAEKQYKYPLDIAQPPPDITKRILRLRERWNEQCKQLTTEYNPPRTDLYELCIQNLEDVLGTPLLPTGDEDLKKRILDSQTFETTSIFEFLIDVIKALKEKNPGKKIKFFFPGSFFGCFEGAAKKAGVETEMLPVNKDGKIDQSSFKTVNPSSDALNIFAFHNPTNPTQQLYNQDEINALSKIVDQKFDVIFEDLTLAELYAGSPYDQSSLMTPMQKESTLTDVSNTPYVEKPKAFEAEDAQKYRQKKPGFFTHTCPDKTIIARSSGKTITAADRISWGYIPAPLLFESHDEGGNKYAPLLSMDTLPTSKWSPNGTFDLLHVELLKEKTKILKPHAQFYRETQDHLVQEVDRFNYNLREYHDINFIDINPKKWESANTVNINVTELHTLLSKNGFFDDIRKDPNKDWSTTHSPDRYEEMDYFFKEHIDAHLIKGSLNNMGNEKLYFRLRLGGESVRELIKGMFKDMAEFVTKNIVTPEKKPRGKKKVMPNNDAVSKVSIPSKPYVPKLRRTQSLPNLTT